MVTKVGSQKIGGINYADDNTHHETIVKGVDERIAVFDKMQWK